MKEYKSINLKVNSLNKEEYFCLIKDCNKIFDEYVNWAYKFKTFNKVKAHHANFYILREKYPNVKAGLQQSARDNALESCKRGKLKDKIKPKQTLSIRLNIICFTLRGNQLTLIGINKRHREILHIPDYYKKIYENWKFKSASLNYDKKKKQFWIHITFENLNPIQQKKIDNTSKILGIDRGIYNVISTSDGNVYSSKNIVRIKNNYSFLRRKLQKKGTRSAKKLLRKISGKEKRFVLDMNHCLSKQVANSQYDVFVLEKLKGFKKRKKSHNWNRKISNWSYFQFQALLTYKANSLGKQVVYVNPAYTSQECSKCGTINKEHRQVNMYRCSCGNKQHADLNAAKNIKQKWISQNLLKDSGVAVNQPYKSVYN